MNTQLILQSGWIRYALAFVVVAFAASLRIWPLQSLESTLVWLTFYPAVMVVAVYGGFSAGAMAIALACLTAVYLWPLLVAHPFINKPADWLGMVVFIFTCTMISSVAEAMRRSQARESVYRTLFESMDEGFCVAEMIYDRNGKPIDYRFVETNPAFERHTGLHRALGKTIREMVPDHDAHWFEIYGKVAQTGEAIRFENPATAMQRYYDVYAYRIGGPGSNKVGILFKDMTANKELRDRLEAQANTDVLTGCQSRRYFLENAEREFVRNQRYGGGMSMFMLDLDKFKNFNDMYGHAVGDAVLVKLAQVCGKHLREVDVMGRLGGEEFAVLLPQTGNEQALDIAERLCEAVAAEEITLADKTRLRFTTSIGVASSEDGDTSLDQILDRADKTLYRAKEAGRNRVMA